MKPKRYYFRTTQLFGTSLRYGAPVFIGFTVIVSGLTANAGDILRGGAGSSSVPARGGSNQGGASTPAASDAARANAKDTLARTNRTLDAVRNMQNAARNAAINGKVNLGKTPGKPLINLPRVTNGLAVGGLQPNTDPSKWTGAEVAKQIVKNGRTQVTIKQTTQQALLNWQTFNVGKETTLTFDQTAGGTNASKWIAFNNVSDPTGNPTQILGSIKATGQVYLINTNGIIFGGSSQVNARGLTVSSLPINENLISRGLLNNPDGQFLFSGLGILAGANGTPEFIPEAPASPDGKYGDVIVQKGAVLKSPTNSAKVGGRIMLAGPNVTNQGTISTPDGQTILAAGLEIGFAGHPSSDPTLRGLDTYIGAVSDPLAGEYAGSATNEGLIDAARGSITITGKAVRQLGVLDSTTSATLNGRIDLTANFNAIANTSQSVGGSSTSKPFIYRSSGLVHLGADSMIRVLPELDSKETTIGTELALRSTINIAGKVIHLGSNSTLLAPNALVDISAGDWIFTGGTNPFSTFLRSTGQVYLDEGALIDVSGSTNVSAPVSQNIISVDLRAAELADSPLQRSGILRNSTINVDIRDAGFYQGDMWVGTPLANVSGFANLIQRNVGQLTVSGGTVNINAGQSVVMRDGSRIDVSGGSTRFEAGRIETTILITNGRLVDIRDAKPDVVYDGIYDASFTETNFKFGVGNVFRSSLAPDGSRYDPGSTEGAAGGTLAITAPAMALDGKLLGRTIQSINQRTTPPKASKLTLSFSAKDISYPSLPTHSPTPPKITFLNRPDQIPADPFAFTEDGNSIQLADARLRDVYLSPELVASGGFGDLTINNQDGEILIPEGVEVATRAGGAIALSASNIAVEGSIISPSGTLSFKSYNVPSGTLNLINNTTGPALPIADPNRGIFSLGSSAIVSTAGLMTDDRPDAKGSGTAPISIKGGIIAIDAYSAVLSKGGRLDVSGGAALTPLSSVTYGDAGSLSVSAGQDLSQAAVLGGTLELGSTLAGFSGARPGSLSIAAPAIQVGGKSAVSGVNLIDESLFNKGGFGSFSLKGTGLASGTPGEFVTGLLIAPEARIRPTVIGITAETGGGKFSFRKVNSEEGIRNPASLTFGATGGINSFEGALLGRGDVFLSKGASIMTDAKGSVAFTGETVTLLGSVTSPGGSISVVGAARFPADDANSLLPTVLLGNTANLSTKGKTVLISNPYHLREGQVLSGGAISISGNIVADRGSVLDVSGTNGVLDLLPSAASLTPAALDPVKGGTHVATMIHSNAGKISLSGSRMLYSDATLIGRAGGSSATGGSLTVSSGRFVAQGSTFNTAEINLVVTQNDSLPPTKFVSKGVGTALSDPLGNPLHGIGNFAISSMESGGFDSLALNGNVRFEGDVKINIPGALRVSSGGVIEGAGRVRLNAGYVSLGQSFSNPTLPTDPAILFSQTDASGLVSSYTFAPTFGTGDVRANAGLIDIGNLSMQGIGNSNFNAREGDIRGNGTLSASGSLTFKAGQIYPTTAATFNVFVYGSLSEGLITPSSISIMAGGTRQLPFSAAGTLGMYASELVQGGTLRAPIGTIRLGWDGSGKAPINPIAGDSPIPVTTKLTLRTGSLTSVSAVDVRTRKSLVIPYGISMDGNSWIDPAGNDITVGGVPQKSVQLAATDLIAEKDSNIDISGGGDLYAYRWISGNGGTKDILASSHSFAVLPGYLANYSPFAPFNSTSSESTLSRQPGYVNSTLKVGDQITLAASDGLPEGTYTLLPARYALMPGAFLLTPKAGAPTNMAGLAGGTSVVSGFISNNLDQSRTGLTTITRFEIASAKAIRTRAEYQDLLANTTFRQAALARELAIPRLPSDAGYLSFSSTAKMTLRGNVMSAGPTTGRGSVIDINSAADILINSSGKGGNAGDLVFKADSLNDFGAESLLIGGLRTISSTGAKVTVNSQNVTLDNAGTPLSGTDVVLVAKEKLSLLKGSSITGIKEKIILDSLILSDPNNASSGSGVLVRVSGDAIAPVQRFGVSSSEGPTLMVEDDVELAGESVVLDSTDATELDPTANILAGSVSLSSGQISVILKGSGQLTDPAGLVLSGDALASLQRSGRKLRLISYSTFDIYGSGTIGSRSFESLDLQAASIRGLSNSSGGVTFSAKSLSLSNSSGVTSSQPVSDTMEGAIRFDANEIILGSNEIHLEGYTGVTLAADRKILTSGSGAFLSKAAITLETQLLTGANASNYKIASEGALQLTRPTPVAESLESGGLGSKLNLQGSMVRIDSGIRLPSGTLLIRATSGDLTLGGKSATELDVGGIRKDFLDVSRFTNGGTVELVSDRGNITVGMAASLSVAANTAGGDAGYLNLVAPKGVFTLEGKIDGTAGSTGSKGSFGLDTAKLINGSLAGYDRILNDSGFTQSREYRIRTGDVNIGGSVIAHSYRTSADSGSIFVSGQINASGVTGGTIELKANGDLVIQSSATLNAAGKQFDAAGKGGLVVLEAANSRNGQVNLEALLELQSGSTINLSVAAADERSESLGKFTGKLHLRAPRNSANDDVQVEAIDSTIIGASSIVVEGVKLYDLTGSGDISSGIRSDMTNDSNSFLGTAGGITPGYFLMLQRLTGQNSDLDLTLAPGIEVLNRNGSLTLGSSTSSFSDDWNLSSLRFGPKSVAGILTLRASENLVFHNALSDGFSGGASLWQSPLVANNPLLSGSNQGWSFRLTAGADLSAASFRAVRPAERLGLDAGFLKLGKDAGAATAVGGASALTSSVIGNLFQVIRTGSGDIDITTGRSLQLLNPFASIYTAGTQVADPTSIVSQSDFIVPILNRVALQGNLGTSQQLYPAQYSMAGGNVSIRAYENIERKTRNNFGLIDDSTRQLPNNWLYRRGIIGLDGAFGSVRIGSGFTAITDPSASTSWWVDFSNFFQGVGALGGGNVTLNAAQNVNNIDAVIPTNSRAAQGRPLSTSFVELGGGDLKITAGNDISGGVYYLERGKGILDAGGSITTNGTRSPSFGLTSNLNDPESGRLDPLTWLPTTLFIGKSSFDANASGDLLLGPVSNPFLLPQGINNRFWYKSYFSTIATNSEVKALSLGGSVTFRDAVTLPSQNQPQSMLRAWYETQLLFTGSASSTAWLQPWLRLNETSLTPFSPAWSLTASSISLASLAGDVNVSGEFNLAPSSRGQLEIVAAGSVNAFHATGLSSIITPGRPVQSWASATINLSDADPQSMPTALTPLASFRPTSLLISPSSETDVGFMNALSDLLTESGSITGINAVLQTRQGRHTSTGLHADDHEPLRIYALDGNLSGIMLYSGKTTQISVSNDISDIALYIQNLSSDDASVVSAGRDITAFDASSPLRLNAFTDGNSPAFGQSPLAGDIQISGPGSIQILAGRNLDLGTGMNNTDGTGTGITSIGNLRNPYLSSQGADLIIGAGIGSASSLAASQLALNAFITEFVLTPVGESYLEKLAPGVDFNSQPAEEQARLASQIFQLILRDTGRRFNDPESPGFRKYDEGFAAIKSLFPSSTEWEGNILTQGRDIRTKSGGAINLLAPGGGLKMANTTIGNPLTPPGIITESGGTISIFTDQSVDIGVGRIFTLRGGDVGIWSSKGDIAAGSSSRTVQSAPPTRVVIDPQSASVETDLAGLATGGGIGVLATVKGVKPGDVDLIAPEGTIDAGDAGIRVSGNINLAAVSVVNAGNIAAGGTSTGAPSASPSASSISTVTNASNATAAGSSDTVSPSGRQKQPESLTESQEALSVISVEVVGYGGTADDEEEQKDKSEDSISIP